MSEHTPGPWCEVDGQVRSSDSRVHVADVYHNSQSYGVANARLIAAAPDMLAALAEIVDKDTALAAERLGRKPREAELCRPYARARAAIAKARGKA